MSIYTVLYEESEGTILTGTTHGCGCCADDEKLTEVKLREHIKSLEDDIVEARKLMLKHFGVVS